GILLIGAVGRTLLEQQVPVVLLAITALLGIAVWKRYPKVYYFELLVFVLGTLGILWVLPFRIFLYFGSISFDLIQLGCLLFTVYLHKGKLGEPLSSRGGVQRKQPPAPAKVAAMQRRYAKHSKAELAKIAHSQSFRPEARAAAKLLLSKYQEEE
ncbi:MAG: hypothetical protein AAGJ82_04935, partial [Bacteroidota bacterium]